VETVAAHNHSSDDAYEGPSEANHGGPGGGGQPRRKSSYFLGDPPPDPRFLASLGELSLVEHDHCSVVDLY
jgi:hypothetical protein